MRPNVSRSRKSFVPRPRRSSSEYFYLRTDQPVGLRTCLCFVGSIAIYALGSTFLVGMSLLFPADWLAIRTIYIPILFFTWGPYLASRYEVPTIVLGVVGCIYAYVLAEQLAGHFDSSSSPVLSLVFLVLLAPSLVRVVESVATIESLLLPAAATLLTGCAIVSEMTKSDRLWISQFTWLPSALLILLSALLIRTRAARLASSLDVPTEASYRLIDISRAFIETPASNVSVFSIRRLIIVASSLVSAWNVHPLCRELCNCALAVPRPADENMPPLLKVFSVMFVFAPFAAMLAASSSPDHYFFQSIRGLASSITDWHDDRHPAIEAPGIWSAAGYDTNTIPTRSILLLTLLTLTLLSTTIATVAPIELSVWEKLRLVTLREVLTVVGYRAIFSLLFDSMVVMSITGPWFAYFVYIRSSAQDSL